VRDIVTAGFYMNTANTSTIEVSMRLRSAVLGLLSIAVVGCGASSTSGTVTATPTPAPLPKADAICRTYDATIGAFTPPYSDTSSPAAATELPGIATWLDKVLAAAAQEQTALKAEPSAAPVNAPFAAVLTKLQAADVAAKANDLAGYKAAFTDYVTANSALSTAAKAANLPDCA
jgi:hypothetical protein